MIRAAINALAYSAGFALGRIERHYRRSVARIAADDLTAITEATGVLVTEASAHTTRVGMAADVRESTGLAGEHFDEWSRELAWRGEQA